MLHRSATRIYHVKGKFCKKKKSQNIMTMIVAAHYFIRITLEKRLLKTTILT